MSISNSRIAYEDCYNAMDKALESESGARIGFENEGDATFYRLRMNKARGLDRKYNGERYASDHPMHSQSDYDALMFRIRKSEGMYWIYMERKAMRGVLEEIKKDKEPEPIRQTISYRRF